MSYCSICTGLICEPNKAYSYSGLMCTCNYTLRVGMAQGSGGGESTNKDDYSDLVPEGYWDRLEKRLFDMKNTAAEIRQLREINTELLETLKAMLQSYEVLKPPNYSYFTNLQKKAQAAIAKAEGVA